MGGWLSWDVEVFGLGMDDAAGAGGTQVAGTCTSQGGGVACEK
jgi:hypothetical protein